jgi:hypothetical protein
VTGAALNIVIHGFPALSTLSLIYGTAIYGFFIALDMALARERAVILNALAQNTVLPPQKRLFSMTRRFSLVAVAAVICVSVVNISVIARDMSWLTTVGTDPAATREAILSVTYEIVFIMAVLLGLAVNLIVSYSRNLTPDRRSHELHDRRPAPPPPTARRAEAGRGSAAHPAAGTPAGGRGGGPFRNQHLLLRNRRGLL